ncbi:MAG TPA: hypothetical protein VG324_24620, partial [Blastocatellia bacterium]|nr:hypothetical protein [Blastocatellia bacterium]
EQMDSLFRSVLDKMVQSRWLDRYVWTEGRGYHLVWTAAGGQKSRAMKVVIAEAGLLDDDRSPHAFDVLAHGEALLDPPVWVGEMDSESAFLWRILIAELGLRGDADGLLALVHIVHAWG